MSPDGKPIQVHPSALQSVSSTASIGRSQQQLKQNVLVFETRIANKIRNINHYMNSSLIDRISLISKRHRTKYSLFKPFLMHF